MKILPGLLILIGLGLLAMAAAGKFLGLVLLFPNVKLVSHLVLANTCFLLALILKLENK
ncbi:MAG: hypothetical protein ISS34_05545 [Candidatus Omnitrophica bacterium]|nr:hypothetical protein [Candidatus Omnitrophota bacterium]